MSTGSGAGIDASKCCKRGGMCACGGGICSAEKRVYSGVREFTSPVQDVMQQTCEQCGITGLHLCDKASPQVDKSSPVIQELERMLAASEKELEGARRGLRLMTDERNALLDKVKELAVNSSLDPIGHKWDDEGDHCTVCGQSAWMSGGCRQLSAITADESWQPISAAPSAPQAVAAPDRDARIKMLEEALQFYANGDHFYMHDPSAWDTVSGEPLNFYEDESNTATVEDGTIAKMVLAGTPIPDGEDEAPQPIAAHPCDSGCQINTSGDPQNDCGNCRIQDVQLATSKKPDWYRWRVPGTEFGHLTREPNASLSMAYGEPELLYAAPIAAPVAELVHIGNYANVSADALAGSVLSAASQQRVPALSRLIVAAERVIKDWDGEADDMADLQNAVRAAQLVQQRATLSDEEIADLRASLAQKEAAAPGDLHAAILDLHLPQPTTCDPRTDLYSKGQMLGLLRKAADIARAALNNAQGYCDKCGGSGEMHVLEGRPPDDYWDSTASCDQCGGTGAALAQPAAVDAPQGWILVPIEATQAMCEAAHFGPNCAENALRSSDREFWQECYRAMIVAIDAQDGEAKQ